MSLLEREPLLTQLEETLAGVTAAHGAVICLLGEAGIGKTSLAREFAASSGVRVLWGACEDLAAPEALGPLRDWQREAGWPAMDAHAAAGDGSRLSLFSATLSALANQATIAVIEDLHWADDATLDLVRFLGRRIADQPVLLLITARDDTAAARQRIAQALAPIPIDLRTRLTVPRLTKEAVLRLAGASGRNGDDIFAVTGGNAFFVSEILEGGRTLPATVRDAVLARHANLSRDAQSIVEAAAIFPRSAEDALLRALLPDRDSAIWDAAIAETIDSGLMIDQPQSLAFRHEIARHAIEDRIPQSRRTACHRQVLAMLRQRPDAPLARLVHHADQAGDAAAMREFAPRAAEAAARLGAHREAAHLYKTALKYANTLAVGERITFYRNFAFELHLIGRVPEAIDAQLSAVELYRLRGDRTGEGDGLRWLSRLHYLDGNRVEADRFAAEALAILETGPPGPELAMAHSNLAQLAMLADDSDAAISWGRRAVTLARQFDRPDILAHALNNVGAGSRWRDPAEARKNLNGALEIALENDLPEHAARAYTNAAFMEMEWRENTNAYTLFQAGLDYCQTRDLDTWHSYMSGCLAELLVREGKWEQAESVLGSESERHSATALTAFPAKVALARIAIRRGEPGSGTLLSDLSAFLDKGMEPHRFLSYATLVLEHAFVTGATEKASPELAPRAHKMARDTGDHWTLGEICFWNSMLIWPPLDAAEAAAPYRHYLAGDWQEAARIWMTLDTPYERALCLLAGDAASRQHGLEILETLGARATAERFRRHLRDAGLRGIPRGPRPSTRANPAGLTRRQMQVLRLLDQGLTNAEIANRLFVSTKTVDHHVSAILGKLSARTRGEAAARAREAGLIETGSDLSA